MKREEIVTALRCCAFNGEDSCEHCTECPAAGDDCESELQFAAAEADREPEAEIEALRRANEGLRFNLDLWMGHARKTVGADMTLSARKNLYQRHRDGQSRPPLQRRLEGLLLTQEKIVAALREHAEWAAGNEGNADHVE